MNKRKKIFEKYAKFLVRRPYIILLLVASLTIISAASIPMIKTKGMSYKNMLPKNIESVKAMDFISDEFGSGGDTITIVLETSPNYPNSNEIKDIRDPRVMEYSSLLTQKISKVKNVISVSSASELLKERNDGHLPKTKTQVIELMKKELTQNKTNLDTKQVLSKTSLGISEIQKGLGGETKGLGGVAQGLNSSKKGLEKIGEGISEIGKGITNLKITKNWAELIASIEEIKYLVEQSNATSSQKNNILASLDDLEQSVMELGKEIEITNFASQEISKSLEEISQEIYRVKDGLDKLENSTLQLKELNVGLNQGLSKIKEGLEKTQQYVELFGKSSKDELTSNKKEENPFDNYISKDYTLTIINVELAPMDEINKDEVIEEIDNIVRVSNKPPGLKVSLTGSPVIFKELKAQVRPTMQKTSMLSFVGILLVVILLFFSIRYGINSLLGIGFGNIWALGFIALLGMNMSPETSGAIAMVMGIGIDFGIQVVSRFKQELRNKAPEKALIITLTNVMEPMLITTLSILIGFRAMSLGKLTFLASLGNILSLGVVACFLAAITVVPSILIISEKYFGSKK